MRLLLIALLAAISYAQTAQPTLTPGEPCTCPDGTGWSSSENRCKAGSTTKCSECSTMDTCEENDCSMRCEYNADRLCQCDENCVEHGNCCEDYSITCEVHHEINNYDCYGVTYFDVFLKKDPTIDRCQHNYECCDRQTAIDICDTIDRCTGITVDTHNSEFAPCYDIRVSNRLNHAVGATSWMKNDCIQQVPTNCIDVSGLYELTYKRKVSQSVMYQTDCMGHSSDGWGFVVGPPPDNVVIITRNVVTGNFTEDGEILFSNNAFYKRYTLNPTTAPSKSPSNMPTSSPTSTIPTNSPSLQPHVSPTTSPSVGPTVTPTAMPSCSPPTVTPTVSNSPTMSFPSTSPTMSFPSTSPTGAPISVISMRFSNSYEDVIALGSDQFLLKCTEMLSEQGVICYDIYEGSTIITFLGEHDNLYDFGSDIINDAKFRVPGFPVLHTEEVVNTRAETLDRVSTEIQASIEVISEIVTTTTTNNYRSLIKDDEEEDLWTFETLFWICIMCFIALIFCCLLIYKTRNLKTRNDRSADKHQIEKAGETPKEAWAEKKTLNVTTPQAPIIAPDASVIHFKRNAPPREIF